MPGTGQRVKNSEVALLIALAVVMVGAMDFPLNQSHHPLKWSEDGRRVSTEDGTKSFDVERGLPVADVGWPGPSDDFQKALQLELEGLERARKFDIQRILKRNRAWQNPNLDSLSSVQFLHRMFPTRLDERFSWRRDGACSVEVMFREDDQAESEIGRLWVLTPDDLQLSLGAGGRYPRRTQQCAADAADERLGHLMGTRANFLALDWGRHPDRYVLTDVRPADTAGQTILTIQPDRHHPDAHANRTHFRENFGAMFHTTSWSYMHDLQMGSTDLLIDDATGRILQESVVVKKQSRTITSTLEKESRTIAFRDWLDLADGTSVPQLVTIEVPHHKFHAEYQFQVPVESLWILKSGKSWFDDHEPQQEEIVDLQWNSGEVVVAQHLKRMQISQQELERPASDEQPTTHSTATLELGETVPLRWTGPRDPTCEVIESLKFTIARPGPIFPLSAGRPTFRLDLTLSQPLPKSNWTAPLSIVFYDDEGRPVESFAVPLAAVESLQRSADGFLKRIRDHSRLWIDPDLKSLPDVSYRFHRGDKNESDHSLQDATNPHAARGVTMTIGLDGMLKSPARYRLPVLIEAEFESRKVDVAVISGSTFGWVFGCGIHNGWTGGYCNGDSDRSLLIVDHDTGRPLLERYRYGEVHFLDYCEPQPGQFVPQRIVFRRSADLSLDFRFQVVNNCVWLFHHSVNGKGERGVSVDNIRVAGEPPRSIEQDDALYRSRPRMRHSPIQHSRPNVSLPTGRGIKAHVASFDWSRVTNRTVAAGGTEFERELASYIMLPDCPLYELLGRMALVDDRRIRIDLDRTFLHKSATRWSLSRNTKHGPLLAVVDMAKQQLMSTTSIPVKVDQTVIVDVASDSERKNRVRSVRMQRMESGEWKAVLELVSQDHYTEQQMIAAGVLVNERGEPVASAQQAVTYRVYEPIYNSDDLILNFGILPDGITPKRMLLGVKSQKIGEPVGSLWGIYDDSEPVFSFDRMLSSDDPDVWVMGLVEIYDEYQADIHRGERRRGDHRRRNLAKGLAPLRQHFERLFEQGRQTDGLSLLCRLAGYSADVGYVPRLIALLEHQNPSVRDSAAIGLALLKDRRVVSRVRELAKTVVEAESLSRGLANDVKNALDLLEESAP